MSGCGRQSLRRSRGAPAASRPAFCTPGAPLHSAPLLPAPLLRSKSFLSAIELLVELASLQTAFLTLDEAIKTTNRRVNALEHVVKPRLENTIAYIKVRPVLASGDGSRGGGLCECRACVGKGIGGRREKRCPARRTSAGVQRSRRPVWA